MNLGTLPLEQLHILGFIALAMLLGACVGFDRELADRPAGLRTHMLVAGAAALLVALGDVLISNFAGEMNNNVLRSDPIRIIEAVITGVAFLGAGTIIRGGTNDSVKGLTTAASLLFVAAIGICVALAQFIIAVGATIFVLVILRGLRFVDQRLRRWHRPA